MQTVLTATDEARAELREHAKRPRTPPDIATLRQEARMARKAEIYRSPPFDAAMAGGIGEADGKRSRRVAHICERYLELLRRAELPAFSEPEWVLMREALDGTLDEPALLIKGIWMRVDDVITMEGAADTLGVDGPALIERLKGLSYVQEVALVEEIERWWAERSRGGASVP